MKNKVFATIIGLMIVTELFAVGVLSYLGTFSRHIADDYCESAALKNESVLSAVLDRYVSGGSNRYSNLLFVGLAEKLGKNNIQFLPFLMLILWSIGSVWIVYESRKLAKIDWPGAMDILLGMLIVFFSAWQAPNRYQTLFWRSGMATHFAPVVFISLLFGFILFRVNSARIPFPWISILVFLVSFVIGGFSEPPTTFLIVLLLLLILFAWKWNDHVRKQPALNLLMWSLAGVLLAFLIMFFSPTMNTLGHTSLVESIILTARTFRYTFDFIVDTARTRPLPSLISFLITFLVFFVFRVKSEAQTLSRRRKRQIWMALILVPLAQYLLIAASFAPSAYGEGYPADRAQIIGRVLMTVALLGEGALMGVAFANWCGSFPGRRLLFLFGGLALLILAFYPLRAGMVMLTEVPDYREWTAAWDLRETEIHGLIAEGEMDLVVRWLPTREGIKEIDATTRHWVNQCAASYYGVNTIRSVPMNDE